MPTSEILVAMSEALAGVQPDADDVRWTWTHAEAGGATLWPAHSPDFLYRGQVGRYSPCLPTICRGIGTFVHSVYELSASKQLSLIERLARIRWFVSTVADTPAAKWARQQNVNLNGEALAQHYGLATGYMDLTSSFDVACFFATCQYDPRTGCWVPATHGEGVLYRLNWRVIPQQSGRIQPIGLQPFPRPAEQWAWTLELYLGEDFESAPGLQGIRFSHAEYVGEYFLQKFDSGRLLFPSDPLAGLAERILSSTILPERILREVIDDLKSDPNGLPNASHVELADTLRDGRGLMLVDGDHSLLSGAEREEMERLWSLRAPKMLRGVGLQLVRTIRTDPNAT